MQGCQEHMELKGSSSDYTAEVTSQIPRKNVLVSAEVVRELSERLRILEEDGEVLKEAVEERRKLITAICTQFQAVQNSLQLKFQEREGKDLFQHPMVITFSYSHCIQWQLIFPPLTSLISYVR